MRLPVPSARSSRRARNSGVGRHSPYASRTSSGISTSGSAATSCWISPIGKIGVRSSGPAGCFVPGCSGGSGSPGTSGSRLIQCVGICSSRSRNLVGSLMTGRWYVLVIMDGRFVLLGFIVVIAGVTARNLQPVRSAGAVAAERAVDAVLVDVDHTQLCYFRRRGQYADTIPSLQFAGGRFMRPALTHHL